MESGQGWSQVRVGIWVRVVVGAGFRVLCRGDRKRSQRGYPVRVRVRCCVVTRVHKGRVRVKLRVRIRLRVRVRVHL